MKNHLNKRISRREFLKAFLIGFSATTLNWLTACTSSPLENPLNGETIPTSPSNSPLAPSPESSPSEKLASPSTNDPYIVLARNGEPEILVRSALSALGGIEKFVKPRSKVIIKPNICVGYHTFEYAATTNPWVVGELVRLCVAAGASNVQVMDFPFGGSPDQAYVTSGIAEQVTAAGGEMVVMPSFKFITYPIPAGLDIKEIQIYDDIFRADVLINVPIAKHHSLARLTLGMKNLMGLILNRPIIHRNIGQRLADLTSLVMPSLTVIDAIRILMDHGPTGGDLNDVRKVDTIIVSHDIVAADSYAASLFGVKPSSLSYIKAGSAMGLGRSDLENIRIEEINVGG